MKTAALVLLVLAACARARTEQDAWEAVCHEVCGVEGAVGTTLRRVPGGWECLCTNGGVHHFPDALVAAEPYPTADGRERP